MSTTGIPDSKALGPSSLGGDISPTNDLLWAVQAVGSFHGEGVLMIIAPSLRGWMRFSRGDVTDARVALNDGSTHDGDNAAVMLFRTREGRFSYHPGAVVTGMERPPTIDKPLQALLMWAHQMLDESSHALGEGLSELADTFDMLGGGQVAHLPPAPPPPPPAKNMRNGFWEELVTMTKQVIGPAAGAITKTAAKRVGITIPTVREDQVSRLVSEMSELLLPEVREQWMRSAADLSAKYKP